MMQDIVLQRAALYDIKGWIRRYAEDNRIDAETAFSSGSI